MTQMLLVVAALEIGLLQSAGTVPQRPNFAGTWTLQHVAGDPRSQFSSNGPDFLLGYTMIVEQVGDTLAVTQTTPYAHPKITFALDGTESRYTLPIPHREGSWQFLSRTNWQGDSLVIDTTGSWDMKMRWSLTPGGELSVMEWAPNLKLGTGTTHTLYGRRR